MTSYRVVRGINFPSKDGAGEVRKEPGESVEAADLQPKHLEWFLEVGAIEEAPAKGLEFTDFGTGTPAVLHGCEPLIPKTKR